MIRIALAALLAVFAAPASATELFEAAGNWQGEGMIATGPRAPLERGRCRVEIAPAAGGGDVSITGSCAVAAGLSDISLRLVRGAGGKVNAGFWSAATAQTVQFAGTETDGAIVMEATGALVLDEVPYQSRVEVETGGAEGFTLRQMLRAEGEDAWRLVVDMAYRQAGG
ncbi:hypothetical protein [Sinisalibacter aestuarii]|uniref:DUF1579 domain-containing protein n=1 Tax=Sinisalibacter aestuarii TaxID=2949426 RepID=A0ABQ5LY53_9RHOB|nr:hypothetical protein [Sinisalibacter aestuarii]GKY89331.1 hypothetical protein STA1M1_32000 [Sinisalibacter aestuarii]